MESLLYFAFLAGLIFLMMRFGCGAHIMGHDHGRTKRSSDGAAGSAETLRWIPPETDFDPVCGKTVRTDRARSSVHDGTVYYFCSRECREIFEAAPEQHIGGGVLSDAKKLERSHV